MLPFCYDSVNRMQQVQASSYNISIPFDYQFENNYLLSTFDQKKMVLVLVLYQSVLWQFIQVTPLTGKQYQILLRCIDLYQFLRNSDLIGGAFTLKIFGTNQLLT